MILKTGDFASYSIYMLKGLLDNMGSDEVWIELHLYDGTKREGLLRDVDFSEVCLQDESGDEPWGETHPWDDVRMVVVP